MGQSTNEPAATRETTPGSVTGHNAAKGKTWLTGRRAVVLTAGAILTVVAVVLTACLVGLLRRDDDDDDVHHEMNNVVVDLGYSNYSGLGLDTGVNQFLGMRYAAPPLKDLRWRAPAAPLMTTGEQLATKYKPFCLATGAGFPVDGQSEDCLFVNVWAPAKATPQSKFPVWLFIQGGGYAQNANANWGGAEVVKTSGNNIVLVNFNYRVGLWGFLASERLRKDGDLNAGLLDQRMLMRWVKTHISKFGGDPDHVVIHGGSAGAGSVALHMVAYGGRDENLFVGAMMDSLFFPSQPYVSELEWQFDRLVQQTGCDETDTSLQVACLRQLSTDQLQKSNIAQPFPGRSAPPLPLWYWTPSIDGKFLTDLPYNLYDQRKFVQIPVLSGTTTNEGSIFGANAATEDEMATFFADNFPKLTAYDTDSIVDQYPLLPPLPDHNAWFPSTSKAYGEATFICPCINTLDAMQSQSNSTSPKNSTAASSKSNSTDTLDLRDAAPMNTSTKLFSYRYNVLDYDYVAAGLGVPHLFTAAAVFGPGSINGANVASYYTYNAAIVPVVMRYWISFVRALDPNVYRDGSAPFWELWQNGQDRRRVVLETNISRMETVPLKERARCDFWADLGEVMEQKK